MRQRKQKAKIQTSLPLVILAGLPHPIASATAKFIEQSFHGALRVVSVPASGRDGVLYTEEFVEQLLSATVGYAQRQAKLKDPIPAPSELWLAYVPSPDEEQLLAPLDFAVFPVRLGLLAEYKDGRQLRHDLAASREESVSRLQEVAADFREIKQRLSTFSQREPLFLPGANFLVRQDDPLSNLFLQFRKEERPWDDSLEEVGVKRADHDDLPLHVKKGVQRNFFADARGLLFPRDPGLHGPLREMEEEPEAMDEALYLRSGFRFGVPLPPGFHHDVQYPGRPLGGTTFQCSRKGALNLKCDYANVYPDDFVRPSQ